MDTDSLEGVENLDASVLAYLLPFLMGVILFIIIAGVISYVLQGFFLQAMFKKANFEPSWGSWVPVYNTYLTLKFGGQNAIWFWIYLGSALLAFIPVVGEVISVIGGVLFIIVCVYAYININKSFGKQENLALWTLFAVFFPLIWMGVLAYSSAKWKPVYGPVFLPEFGGNGGVKTI